uniref:Uncharacterized protein n=1 Tax=Fagus sylvatica TaxID=28930 RepID=A0A2N9I9L3_FAGSY
MPSQPRATSLSLSPISLLAPKPPSPSHRSHLAFSLTDLSARTEATVTVAPKPPQRPAEHPCTDLYLTDQILI